MEHPEPPEPLTVVHRGGLDRECGYSLGRQGDLASGPEPVRAAYM